MLFNAEMIDIFLDGFDKSSVIKENDWRISHVRLSSEPDCSDLSVLTISRDGPDGVICRNGENVFTVRNADVFAVANAVTDQINYYNQWEINALNAVRTNNKSLDNLSLLKDLFPDYLVRIVTPLGQILFPEMESQGSHIDPSLISMVRHIPSCYRISLGIKGLTLFWDHAFFHKNTLMGNIVFPDNSYIIFSAIEKDRPPREPELHLAELAQSIFEQLEPATDLWLLTAPHVNTLASLLNGEEVDEALLRRLETTWNYKIADGAHLVLVRNAVREKYGTPALVSSINEKIPSALAFTYAKQILCLLPIDDFSKNCKILGELAVSSRSLIVFSTVIHSWHAVAQMYGHMSYVLSKVMEKEPDKQVIYCADYIWDYCLWTLQDQADNMLIHPDIQSLMALDNDGRYLDTLHCLLSNNCRMSTTAEKLHIHLSTLKYRLEKINSTISFDPDNYLARMAFLLSYDLMKAAEDGSGRAELAPTQKDR